MSSVDERRDLNKGFGDGMSRAFEIAITPVVFGAVGYGIDLLAGTGPWFAVGLALFAVIGMFVRVWYGYDAEMRAHEASSPWSASRPQPPAAPVDDDLWSARRGASR